MRWVRAIHSPKGLCEAPLCPVDDVQKSHHTFQSLQDGRLLGNTYLDWAAILYTELGGTKNVVSRNHLQAVTRSDKKITLCAMQQRLSDTNAIPL
jgi:hypothetical protein